MRRWWGWLAAAIVPLLALIVAETGAGQASLRRVGLVKATQGYTELAFYQTSHLPPIAVAHSEFHVLFVIHNVTADAHAYHWAATLTDGARSHPMAKGQVPLAPGARTVITFVVKMKCSGGNAHIVVQLADPAQSIAFWTQCLPKSGSLS